MLSLNSFLDRFPEFSSQDPLQIEQSIEQVSIETDNYDGLNSIEKQQLAVALHVAHLLSILRDTSTTPYQGRITKIKSNHDEIQYQATSSLYDWDSSTYGTRLQSLLSSHFISF